MFVVYGALALSFVLAFWFIKVRRRRKAGPQA